MLNYFACCTVREMPKSSTDTRAVEPLTPEAMDTSPKKLTEEHTAVGKQVTVPVAAEANAILARQHEQTNGFSPTVLSKHLALVAPEEMPWATASTPWLLTFGVLLLIVASLRSLQDSSGADGCKWVESLVVVVSVSVLLLAQRQLRWLQDRFKITSGRRPLLFSATTPTESKAAAAANGSDAEALLALFKDRELETPELVLDEKTCKRFLVGWKGEFDRAAERLRKYQTWRRSAKPSLLTAADIPTEFATGKGYHHGFDRAGRPIIWGFASRHDKRQRDIEESVRLILFCLESAIRSGEAVGKEQVTLVFDLEGFGSKSMDFEMVGRLFKVLAKFYPERLGQVLLWRAPGIFSMFWKLISPYIDPVSFQKIKFAKAAELCEFIELKHLPHDVVRMQGLTTAGVKDLQSQ